jgi:hypothetical protein
MSNEHIAVGDPQAHAHGIALAAGHTAPACVFTDAELEHFRAEDFSAGKAVVLLMLCIFSTGVIIYSIVAYWVIFFSH